MAKYKDLHIGVIISKNLRIVPRAKHIEVCLAPIPEFGFLATSKELCREIDAICRDTEYYLYSLMFRNPIRILARFYTSEIISKIGFPSEKIDPEQFESLLRRAIFSVIKSSCSSSSANLGYVVYIGKKIGVYPIAVIGSTIATMLPMVIGSNLAEKILCNAFFFDLEKALRKQLLDMDLLHTLNTVRRLMSATFFEHEIRKTSLPNQELEYLVQIFLIANKLAKARISKGNVAEILKEIPSLITKLSVVVSDLRFGKNPIVKDIGAEICSLLDHLADDIYRRELESKTVEEIEMVVDMLRNIGIKVPKPRKIGDLETALRTTMELVKSFASMLRDLANKGYFITTNDRAIERIALRFVVALNKLASSEMYTDTSYLKYSTIVATPETIYVGISTSPSSYVAAIIDYRHGVADIICSDDRYRRYILALLQRLIHPSYVVEIDEKTMIEFEPSIENIERMCLALAAMVSFGARWKEIVEEAEELAERLIDEDPEKALEIISREIGVSIDKLKSYAKKLATVMSSTTLEEFDKWFKKEIVEGSLTAEKAFKEMSKALSKYLSAAKQRGR